jgi:putative membrane protein
MDPQKINELEQRIGNLLYRQSVFYKEIKQLENELAELKRQSNFSSVSAANTVKTPVEKPTERPAEKPTERPTEAPAEKTTETPVITAPSTPKPQFSLPTINRPKQPSDLEKIIGESWINKIGILIVIIGVAIGAKYSIENELISPLTRIILGYLVGIGLLGFGIKLKPKFEGYSAVLVSGSISIFYFITYFAYSFYNLIPQILAFVIMLIFTVFTVFAAIKYNRVVIAHIGLIGAYAVPFLLSSGSGRVDILFSYMLIINLGILFISIKRDWKTLHYSAFFFTWLIYGSWFADKSFYSSLQGYEALGIGFATAFFLIFYGVSLFNNIISKEKLDKINIILILLNSFIYFGFGYGIFNSNTKLDTYLGLFTLFNAVIHFVVLFFIKSKKLADSTLFYSTLGMVFTFITIAIPIQLDGSWVTLLWIAQGTILFWIGKTKNIPIYEKISLPILGLSFLSLLEDWSFYRYANNGDIQAFWNINFLTGILAILGYGFVVSLSRKHAETEENQKFSPFNAIKSFYLPALLVLTAYLTFRNEIAYYFNYWLENSSLKGKEISEIDDYSLYNYDINVFKNIYLIAYSLVFFGGLALLNFHKFKNKVLGISAIVIGLLTLLSAQTFGLEELGELRYAYINGGSNEYFDVNFNYILVRYLLWGSVAFALWAIFKNTKSIIENTKFHIFLEMVIHISILNFLSNELVTWMDIAGYQDIFKLGLSILWSVYSLLLVSLGIYKKKKYLRISALVLFGVTLAKLFLYDISNLSTISKTVVLIVLGLLLLIISFLYNKFKDKIGDETKH